MKKLFENWRHFKEGLEMPSLFSPITQFEFAEDYRKLGTYLDSEVTDERKNQIRVLVKLFKDLEKAPEEEQLWSEPLPDPDKGESYSTNTVLDSIYTTSGESDEFVFPNKEVALDFFDSVDSAKTGTPQPEEEIAYADTIADTLEPTIRQPLTVVEPTIRQPRQATDILEPTVRQRPL